MRCPDCQADNPADNAFCEQCGARLGVRCPQCQASVRVGVRFCGKCGHAIAAADAAAATPSPIDTPAAPRAPVALASEASALAAERQGRPADYTPKHLAERILKSRSALEGERRQVTVLFADLAGFTALAERLDPEDVHALINHCFELITAEVHRFEGTINQYTGDGVMALFGAPIAHEDGARRAVHAGLAIQRALDAYARQLAIERGLSLQLRIGLNTGPVVVGRIGDDLRMDYTAVGDTTNLAARMQQVARPGSVTITDATQQATAGFFETLDLGDVAVKGRSAVRAWEVLRPRGMRSRLDVAAERGLTPLVGRDRELATLVDRFADAKAGRGQVVCIAGEAGIGKSRLLLEFQRGLADTGEDVTWLEGQCVSFGQSIAFLPLIDQLRRNFGIEERDGEPEIIAKVEHRMRRMGQLEPHIPYVRYLLAVDPGEPSVATMNPLARRRKVFEAVRALTARGAAIRPLILVFEDLHWGDSSTEEYLGGTIDLAAATPLMLILTYRVGYTPPFGSRTFQTTLTLQNLSDDQALAMAAKVLGSSEFPREVRTVLMEKAEGVPLFIEEVAKTLVDLGLLRRDNGGLRLISGLAEVSVPDTIQGIIMARLDRLGDDGKRTVQLASVIGRRFLVRLLDRISGMTERLEGLLAELKTLEIIYEQGLLPEPAYVFKHAVIQDVAYNSLLRDRRRDLHRAVGHAIEELFADRVTEHYEELAHHFTAGEEWTKAFEYLVRSGDRAKEAYANQAALDVYARALEIASRVIPPLPIARIGEVHRQRGDVFLDLSRPLEAIVEFDRMRDVVEGTADRHAEAYACARLALAHVLTMSPEHLPRARTFAERALAVAHEIGDESVLAEALVSLGFTEQSDGALVAADQKFTRAIHIAERHGLRDVIPKSLVFLGAQANWRGDFRASIAYCERAESVARESHDSFWELFALAFMCLPHIGLGQHTRGLAVIDHGLRTARERGNAFIFGRLINTRGWVHQELGDFRGARGIDEESVEHGRRSKIPNVEVSALINLAYDDLHLGRPRDALGLLEDTLTRVEKVGFGAHRWRWANHLSAYISETLLALGDADRALAEADSCLARAGATGAKKYLARGHLLKGQIASVSGDPQAAERELREALRLARQIEYPTLTWQAAHALAEALERGDKREDAFTAARLAADTVAFVAEQARDEALRRSFLAWDRVAAVEQTLDRLRR